MSSDMNLNSAVAEADHWFGISDDTEMQFSKTEAGNVKLTVVFRGKVLHIIVASTIEECFVQLAEIL